MPSAFGVALERRGAVISTLRSWFDVRYEQIEGVLGAYSGVNLVGLIVILTKSTEWVIVIDSFHDV